MIKEKDHMEECKGKCSDTKDFKDWENSVCTLNGLSYFLGVTIPAAELQNRKIGHTLLICPYPRITAYVLRRVRDGVTKGKVYNISVRRAYNQEIQAGDLTAILASTSSMDTLLCTDILRFRESVLKNVLLDALKKQSIRVVLGKGTMAKEIYIDLPEFSLISCVRKRDEVDDELYPHFENTIGFDEAGMKACCKLEAEAIAMEEGLTITELAADTLASISEYNYRKIQTFLRRIRDYCEVERMKECILTEKVAIEILNKLNVI